MRTVDELRTALRAETDGLQPGLPVAAIRDRARRRSRRRRLTQAGAAMVTGLVVAAAAMYLSLTRPGVPLPQPEPLDPLPSVNVQVDPSFPPLGPVVRTGVRVGTNQELVMWFSGSTDVPQVNDGLLDLGTGAVEDLDQLASGDQSVPGFQQLGQIDDRRSGVVDFGLYVGTVGAVVVESHSGHDAAHLFVWPGNRRYVLFWADHSGTPLPTESDHPFPADTDMPRFVAYTDHGRQLATSDGLTSRRTDTQTMLGDSPTVGTPIDTGVVLADGGKLRLWFVGNDTEVILRTGSVPLVSGPVGHQQDYAHFHQPPDASGFEAGWGVYDGPNGTRVVVGVYTGPAATVTVNAPGVGVTSGTARWSAHPELILFWVAGVSNANFPGTVAQAYDAGGHLLDTATYPG